MDFIYMVLHDTKPFSEEKFNRIYSQNTVALKDIIEYFWHIYNLSDDEQINSDVLELIIESMIEYVERIPAPVGYKVLLWKDFYSWIECIAHEYGLEQDMHNFLNQYDYIYEGSLAIEVLKELHKREGTTKAELSAKLHVSEKTIQTTLRQLDDSLLEGNQAASSHSLYIAGQKIKADISYKNDSDGKGHIKRRFYTPNSIHPIFLQENVMQIGTLLCALAHDYIDNEHVVSRGIAIDIWCQLSDYARNRVKLVYGTKDEDVASFLEEIDEEIQEGVPIGYLSEKEMVEQQDLNLSELIDFAVKRNASVDVRYLEDNVECMAQNVKIASGQRWNSYYLIKDNKDKTVILLEDIREIVFK